MKPILLLSGALIFLFSCNSSDVPEGVLNQDDMKAVLKDMHLADAYLGQIRDTDSVKKVSSAYYQLIFKQHNTSLKQFEKSLNYYAARPVLLDTMYNQILTDLSKSKKDVKKLKKAKKNKFRPKVNRPLPEKGLDK